MRIYLLLILLIPCTAIAELQVDNGKVTARLNSESLSQVIEQFRNQTTINLYIDSAVAGQSVSAEFTGLPVATAVKKILEGTGINFVVLGGGHGNVEKIFIGTNKPPGAPPRRLDSRPLGTPSGRGVVTPVNPPPPGAIQQQPEPDPQRRPIAPAVEVPTGGGYVPANQQRPPQEQQKPEETEEQNEEQ